MKKVQDLKENEAIHCPTEREAEAICLLMHNAGFKWNNGISFLEKTYWDDFRENMCYNPTARFGNSLKYSKEQGFTIHPASDFLPEHFYLGLPLCFVVKKDDSKEWEEYIKWLNKTFKTVWVGDEYSYYGYDNSKNANHGTYCANNLKDFQNNPLVFESPKEFMNIVNKNKMQTKNRFPFMLAPENAQKIINIACPGTNNWKEKLVKRWAETIVLGKTIEISEYFYKEMRKACTADQHKLFDEIFGKDVEDKNAFIKEFPNEKLQALSRELFNHQNAISIAEDSALDIMRPDLQGRSFYVSNRYQVTTHKVSNEGTVIEITKK
jgi:hypothetical protein